MKKLLLLALLVVGNLFSVDLHLNYCDGDDNDLDGICNETDVCDGGDDSLDDDSDGIPNACDVDIYLSSGANFISFHALPGDNSVENIFSSLVNLGAKILGDSESGATQYIDGLGWIGSLLEVDRVSGYWVIIDSSTFLNVTIPTLFSASNSPNLNLAIPRKSDKFLLFIFTSFFSPETIFLTTFLASFEISLSKFLTPDSFV